jgi:hypothetical protein
VNPQAARAIVVRVDIGRELLDTDGGLPRPPDVVLETAFGVREEHLRGRRSSSGGPNLDGGRSCPPDEREHEHGAAESRPREIVVGGSGWPPEFFWDLVFVFAATRSQPCSTDLAAVRIVDDGERRLGGENEDAAELLRAVDHLVAARRPLRKHRDVTGSEIPLAIRPAQGGPPRNRDQPLLTADLVVIRPGLFRLAAAHTGCLPEKRRPVASRSQWFCADIRGDRSRCPNPARRTGCRCP